MTVRQKQLSLFVLCALVLMAGGFGWGYANAYSQFYSISSLLDRETLDLEFNSRLLHYANANQPQTVRAKLYQRLSDQVRYIDRMIASAESPQMRLAAAASLQRARATLDEPRDVAKVAVNAAPAAPQTR